jgi:dimethylaniline monooxygenase (N-oxide forming)
MLDCIVVGAGPGGLVCTKELLEQGISEVVCLEQSANVGGVFTKTYDNLVLTSSSAISMFSDFWVGDGNQYKFWTKEEALDYWTRYARHFGVIDRIRFNSQVMSVVSTDAGWQIQLAAGDTLLAKRLALAIGNNTIPSYPDWKDLLTEVECSHSQEYRNADKFAGKNVVVVGGGESGSDVALGVSRVASKSWVSLRNSTGWVTPRKRGAIVADTLLNRILWGIPREHGATLSKIVRLLESNLFRDPVSNAASELNLKIKAQKGVLGTYGTKTYSLPKAIAHHGCQVVSGIMKVTDGGKTLHTAAGECLKNIDAVIFATGYKNFVSFLPEDLQETDPRNLYKQMFHPKYRDKLVWIGSARPNFGSQFPIMEMQSRFFAMICKEERTLPAPAEMERITYENRATWLAQFEHNAHRLRSLVDFYRYMNDIAASIGCKPPLWEYFFSHPRIWLHIVFGGFQSTQFRLRGPGNKESLARDLLKKLPVGIPISLPRFAQKGTLISNQFEN